MNLSSNAGGKTICLGGTSGVVSGSLTGVMQEITLFTTPATPTDSFYEIDVSGVFLPSANASMACEGTAASVTTLIGTGMKKTLQVGAGVPVKIAAFGAITVSYLFSYRSTGYQTK